MSRRSRPQVKDHFPIHDGMPLYSVYDWIDQDKIHWEPMVEFRATMKFNSFDSDGKRITLTNEHGIPFSFFFSQTEKMIPKMVNGIIEGRFVAAKKGDMYGFIYLGE